MEKLCTGWRFGVLKFDSSWCFSSVKCGSSVSEIFLIYRAHVVCFCTLITILDLPWPDFLGGDNCISFLQSQDLALCLACPKCLICGKWRYSWPASLPALCSLNISICLVRKWLPGSGGDPSLPGTCELVLVQRCTRVAETKVCILMNDPSDSVYRKKKKERRLSYKQTNLKSRSQPKGAGYRQKAGTWLPEWLLETPI
jgi:hypothetical protein